MNIPYIRAPHVEGVSSGVPAGAPNAALLIDFDNVTMGMRSDLSRELKNLLKSDVIRGKVTVQRAYADWRRYPQYIVPLSEASVDLIFAPAYGSSKKNATDIRMAIDGIELVFTRPEIGTFILLTGDSDFSSLVLKLKEYGKYVIGVGIQESSSDILVQNCDEYYSYTSLSGLRKAGSGEQGSHQDPWSLVERAVEQMARRRDVMRSDRLKQVMLELDASFDEKSMGFSKFSRFLTEAAQKGFIQLVKLENGQHEILPGKGPSRPASERPARPSSRDRDARPRNDRSREAPREVAQPAGSPADSAVQPREVVAEQPTDSPVSTPAVTPPTVPVVAEASTPPSVPAPAPAPPPEVPAASGSKEPAGGERLSEHEGAVLRDSHELLVRAVQALSDGAAESGARDSDVKRRMLAFRTDFDEGKLGFAKFSHFLRDAESAGVVRLHRDEQGVYTVRIVAGTRTEGTEAGLRPKPSDAPASEAPAAAAPSTPSAPLTDDVRRLRPRLSSRRRGQEEAGPPLLEGQVVVAPGSADTVPPEKAVEISGGQRAQPDAEALVAPATAQATADTVVPPVRSGQPSQGKAESAPDGGRSQGRKRSGGRPRSDAKPRAGTAEATAETPVAETSAGEGAMIETPIAEAPIVETVPAEKPARQPREPRGRRGRSRSSGGESAKPAASESAEPAKPVKPSKPAPPSPPSELVRLGLPAGRDEIARYITSTYRGVGMKTVERLLEAHGDRLLDVMEAEPDTIRGLLTPARAELLLEQWVDDVAKRRAEAAGPSGRTPPRKSAPPRKRGPGGRRRGGSGGAGRS
jgi:uncharacterized protein (TIGR00288 family)